MLTKTVIQSFPQRSNPWQGMSVIDKPLHFSHILSMTIGIKTKFELFDLSLFFKMACKTLLPRCLELQSSLILALTIISKQALTKMKSSSYYLCARNMPAAKSK